MTDTDRARGLLRLQTVNPRCGGTRDPVVHGCLPPPLLPGVLWRLARRRLLRRSIDEVQQLGGVAVLPHRGRQSVSPMHLGTYVH